MGELARGLPRPRSGGTGRLASSSLPRPPLPLRAILLVDAATCALIGVMLMAAAGVIAGLTALPQALLLYVGAGLGPIAALIALAAVESAGRGWLVRLVILGNMFWVAASVLVLLSPWIAPNALGVAFVLAQALAVAALA